MSKTKYPKQVYIEQANTTGWKDILTAQFGGATTKNSYHVSHERAKIDLWTFDQVHNISFMISDIYLNEEMHFKEMVDSNPIVLIRFIRSGNMEHLGHQSQNIGAGQQHGISMYSTKHPLDFVIPTKKRVQIFTVRIPVEYWLANSDRTLSELNKLVHSEKPWIIYEPMSYIIERDMEQLFQLLHTQTGIVGYSLARCLDICTHFMLQIKKRWDQNETVGVLDIEAATLFKIKEEMEQNIINPPSIDDLTDKYRMSASKLRSNFKKAFGLPPRQYHIEYRLQEAQRRIIHSVDSLIKISADLGFSDQAHLSSQFKKRFGSTPSAIRDKRLDKI